MYEIIGKKKPQTSGRLASTEIVWNVHDYLSRTICKRIAKRVHDTIHLNYYCKSKY